MQLDFVVEEEWSMTLVRRVNEAYKRSGNTDNHVYYARMHWRIVSEREVHGQVYGVRLKTAPRVLKGFNYEVYLVDYLENPRLVPGIYADDAARSAYALLERIMGSADKTLIKIKVTGDNLRDINVLYELVIQNAVNPRAK